MNIPELIDACIEDVNPKNIPAKYIIMIKIIDIHGKEITIDGKEIKNFQKFPKNEIAELRFVLNMRLMKKDANQQYNDFMDILKVY